MSSEMQPRPDRGRQSLSWADSLGYLICFVWFGLLIGIAEALVVLAAGLSAGHFLFVSDHFIWMIPVAEAGVYAIAGIPLLLLACAFPKRKFLFIVVGVFGFFGTLGALSTSGKLIWWAIYILSAGVALRAAWTVRKHPDGFLRLVRCSTPVLMVLVGLLAAGTFGRRAYLEHHTLASLPDPHADAPNVLLVVLDTVRADALSNYSESAVQTPNLDEFGRSGVLFERALSTCSWTLPAHASMFTGRYPNELSADWNSVLDDQYPTLAEVLGSQGYATAGFVANISYCNRATGLARGFAHYEDSEVSLKEIARHSRWVQFLMQGRKGLARIGLYDALGRKDAETVTREFANWLDVRPERPFFGFLNYLDAHDPYLPEKLIAENRELDHEEKLAMKYWRDEDPTRISDAYCRFARDCYDSKISELDAEMGVLLEQLERRGLRENTLVIITSDHGEHFGEHDVYNHGNSLYESAVHVPLMLSWPGHLPAGTRVTVPVTLRDMAATILDHTNRNNPQSLPGNSLRVTWQESPGSLDGRVSQPFCNVKPHPRPDLLPIYQHCPAAKGEMVSLLDGGDYVIRQADETVQLFNFLKLPGNGTNLAGTDRYRERVQQITRELDRFLNALPVSPQVDRKEPVKGHAGRASHDESGRRQVAGGDRSVKRNSPSLAIPPNHQ